MIEAFNPYTPGKPVKEETIFFGRAEVVDWATRQMVAGRRFIVLYGPEQIGKTSLLLHIQRRLVSRFCSALVSLQDVRVTGLASILEHLVIEVAGSLREDASAVLPTIRASSDNPEQMLLALETFLSEATQRLGGRSLILMLDDFDALTVAGNENVTQEFIAGLARMVARLNSLYVIITTTANTEKDKQFYPILFYEASYRRLGPLTTEEATELIVRPVEGILRFDHGVIKRISELTSNHPYYLHFFCYILFDRCFRAGWVNMKQIDDALEEMLSLSIQNFDLAWQDSTPPERAILATLGALRGTRGIFTHQDILAYLTKGAEYVPQETIFATLERLAERGILIKMGALSYRFQIDLFRLWLDHHVSPEQYIRDIHLLPVPTVEEPPPPPTPVPTVDDGEGKEKEEETTQEAKSPIGGNWWFCGIIAAISTITALALITVGVWRMLTIPKSPTPTVVAEGEYTPPAATNATGEPANTPTPPPQPTATPTEPVVSVRQLPAIVYMIQENKSTNHQLAVMDSDGSNPQKITNTKFDESWPVWSPDGKKIAFVSNRDGNQEIYVMPLPAQDSDNQEESQAVNLTKNPSNDTGPVWSPDGKKIAFASRRAGNKWEIFVMDADGGNVQQLTKDGGNNFSPSWSPDSKSIAFAGKISGNWDIYTMQADGSDVKHLTDDPAEDTSPSWSPLGDYIAFESRREKLSDVFIMRTNGAEQTRLNCSSTSDDHSPTWSPDGQRIVFYTNRDKNWEIYSSDIAGNSVVNLTKTDQTDETGPVWRP